MRLALWLTAAAIAVWSLHRLALWLESRGWLYYRRRPSSSALGNAFLEVRSLVEPATRAVVEERTRVHDEEDAEGDPPDTG